MAPSEKGDKSHKKKKKLREPLETQRTHVICGPEKNSHTSTVTAANAYMSEGFDNAWDFAGFKDDFRIEIKRLDQEVMVFDMIGVDPAIANALRRILIAEVPTVAIEHVFFVDNTSIIQDEVFAHRLGLVPINVDPVQLEWKGAEDAPSEANTVVLKLYRQCASRDGPDSTVYSRDLQWLPAGSELPDETSTRFAASQEGRFSAPPAAVQDDILLAKLRPGQCIELEAHCIKGTGKEHAKWSPVATAWYQLLPEVHLLQPVEGKLLEQLQAEEPALFESKEQTVFEEEQGADGQRQHRPVSVKLPPLFQVEGGRLAVGDARARQDLLEVVRRLGEKPEYAECIQVRKRKDHFIFTIESTGALPPEVLFKRAVAILREKADKLAQRL